MPGILQTIREWVNDHAEARFRANNPVEPSRSVDLSDVPSPKIPSLYSRLFGVERKRREQADLARMAGGFNQIAQGEPVPMIVGLRPSVHRRAIDVSSEHLEQIRAIDTPEQEEPQTIRATDLSVGAVTLTVPLSEVAELSTEGHNHHFTLPTMTADQAHDMVVALQRAARRSPPIRRVPIEKLEEVETVKPAQKPGRKVWVDDDRPSVVAKKKADAERKARAEEHARRKEEERLRLAENEKKRKAKELARYEALIAGRAVRQEAFGRRSPPLHDISTTVQKLAEKDVVILDLDNLLLNKADDLAPVAVTSETFYNPLDRETDKVRTQVIPPPHEGYSYYLLGKNFHEVRQETGRPRRVALTLLYPFFTKGQEPKTQQRTMVASQCLIMPTTVSLALRLNLPDGYGEEVAGLALMKNEGREDLRSYRVSHDVLNRALANPNYSVWKLPDGKSVNVLDVRGVIGHYEQRGRR